MRLIQFVFDDEGQNVYFNPGGINRSRHRFLQSLGEEKEEESTLTGMIKMGSK